MNILKHYKALIEKGLTDAQAEEIVFTAYEAQRKAVSKDELQAELDRVAYEIKAELRMYMIFVNAGTVTVGIFLPIFLKFVGVL